MSKYIIEIEDIENFETYFHGKKLVPYVDTAEEAWELARKIGLSAANGGMTYREMAECFGVSGEYSYYDEVMNLPYSEARQKYEEWKKKQEEIRAESLDIIIYTGTDMDGYVSGIKSDGRAVLRLRKEMKKTGRHFPQVVELLKAMKEES